MQTSDDLTVVQPDDREEVDGIVRLVEAAETGGRWGVVLVRSGRNRTVSTHLHRGEPEAFLILDGEVELYGAESVTPLRAGAFVLVPPDTEHALRVLSDEARWLAIWPSALDGIVEALAEARAEGRDDPETLAAIRARHGVEGGRSRDGPG
jgi:quercetin dioxygenase-like cupin family protein